MEPKIQLLRIKKKVLGKLKHIFPSLDSDAVVIQFLENEFKDVLDSFKPTDIKRNDSEKNIWVFWWQGEENAPQLVQQCIKSMKQHANGHKVIVLTQDNWQQYARLPEHITAKVKDKTMSLTQFSDLLRMDLLTRHGGLWLDSTVFVAKDIENEWFTAPFRTIHYSTSTSTISKGRWTGYAMSSYGANPLLQFCKILLEEYHRRFSALADYFLIDYTIATACRNFTEIQALVDSVPLNSEGVKTLDALFSKPYNPQEISHVLETSTFFKLNWKRQYRTECDGKETVYARFLNGGL